MNALENFIQNYGIENLAKTLESDPNYDVFNLLWSQPEQIQNACNEMGFTTPDQVVQWITDVNNSIKNTKAFVNLIDPPLNINIKNLPQIQWSDIHKKIAETVTIAPDAQINNTDANYRLATYEQLSFIASSFPGKRMKWINEVNDCDDFVKAFLGWLALKGLGNIALGFCGYLAYLNDNMMGGHAVVIAMDSEKRIWIIEPQNGKIYTPEQAVKLGGVLFANNIKLCRIYF